VQGDGNARGHRGGAGVKVIRKKCWKCKGTGEEQEWDPSRPFHAPHVKPCSVCRGSGRIEIKQNIKK